jgi:uncharacterized delta-60 repeat protein
MKFNGVVRSAVQQKSSEFICVGDFTTYSSDASSGETKNRIVRLYSGGTIDSTFKTGTGFNVAVHTVLLQPNNKIIVSGNFTQYSGLTKNRIVRLEANGTVDETLNIGTGFNNLVNSTALQSDGKLVCGGAFTTYDVFSRNRIIRLSSGGTVDSTFQIGSGFNSTVRGITIQKNGKILVGGDFTSYSGVTRNKMVRLNSDGSIDGNFLMGTGISGGLNYVYNFYEQTDGKILVAGSFTSYNGVSRNKLVRLTSGGTVDNTFQIGTGFNTGATHINCVQSNGKILIGGSFTSYSGVTKNRIVRLDFTGATDNSFGVTSGTTGFNTGAPFAGLITLNNKILIAGNFTTYNGVPAGGLIILNDDGSIYLS